jgi:hypothetical protein
MNRQQRRALGKSLGKETASTIDLMLNLPNECLTCKKPYDKKDKQMASTWSVEVSYKNKTTNLYCPECFEKRKNAD